MRGRDSLAGRNVRAVSLQNFGTHRGTTRLWIEGRKLTRASIRPGMRFAIEADAGAGIVVLRFGTGDRVVSRRSRNGAELPIVDVEGRTLTDAIGPDATRAHVEIAELMIVIRLHPDDIDERRRVLRLLTRVSSGQALAMGSLAHGGGILDHAIGEGMASAGVRTTLSFAVEADGPTLDHATRASSWSPGAVQVEARMEEVPTAWLPEVDILSAGLPCVGASVAGKAKNGIADAEDHPDAGHLVVAFLDTLRRVNAAIVILENVEGYAKSASATMIRAILARRGYAIHERMIDARDFGAHEMRRRWCLVATPASLGIDLALLETREQPGPPRHHPRRGGGRLAQVDGQRLHAREAGAGPREGLELLAVLRQARGCRDPVHGGEVLEEQADGASTPASDRTVEGKTADARRARAREDGAGPPRGRHQQDAGAPDTREWRDPRGLARGRATRGDGGARGGRRLRGADDHGPRADAPNRPEGRWAGTGAHAPMTGSGRRERPWDRRWRERWRSGCTNRLRTTRSTRATSSSTTWDVTRASASRSRDEDATWCTT